MKNLSKFEMNAVVGGIGPKSSVAGGLGGISVGVFGKVNEVANKMRSVGFDDFETPL